MKKAWRGFTLIELLIGMAILTILAGTITPSIQNALKTRTLESEARKLFMTFQQARNLAVKTRDDHRVGFFLEGSQNWYFIERWDDTLGWAEVTDLPRRAISPDLSVIINFPDATGISEKAVVFSPVGLTNTGDVNQNSIQLKFDILGRFGQPDLRIIQVFAGGAVKYTKTSSGE